MITLTYSNYLVGLVARAEAAAARLAGADPDRRGMVVAQSRREAAFWSARLDGSPLDRDTAARVDAEQREGQGPVGVVEPLPAAPTGGWHEVLRLDELSTQAVAAVEYANLLRCFDAESQIAGWFLQRPLEALGALHGHLVEGLVEPEHIGALRRTHQAIHDGAQGRVIYNPPDPEALPGLLDGLGAWLSGEVGRSGGAGLPTLLVAGAVQERLLEWQPFEAANGRLARAASRVVLRARGMDPHGLAVVERALADDVAGYHGEVAATIRRRGDLGPWLERYAEAAVAAFAGAADAVNPQPHPAPPPRSRAVCEQLAAGATLTLTEYASRAGVDHEVARRELDALSAAGLVATVPGTRGLRFRRR